LQSFERHVFPVIGTVPLRMVTREDIKKVLLKAREKVLLKGRERGGMAAADAVRRHLDEVFAHWIELEWIDRNPAAGKGPKDLTPHESKPRDAVKTMEDARRVMAIMDAAPRKMLRLAHRFQALTGMRPFEAQGARWDEFKVPGQWTIPAERMKGRRGRKRSHTVYLSRQAQDVLDAAKALAPLGEEYVFWGKRGRPLRRDAVGDYMFRALPDDLKHVPHGWRSTFSTIMNKRRRGDGERELIDTMIAHATRGASGAEAHYRRLTEEDFPEARSIGQEWADLLLADAQSAWALAGLDDAQPQPGPQAQPQPDPPQDDWRTAIWQQFFPERAAA
jgi:integrase